MEERKRGQRKEGKGRMEEMGLRGLAEGRIQEGGGRQGELKLGNGRGGKSRRMG